jgi:hypothetical protein
MLAVVEGNHSEQGAAMTLDRATQDEIDRLNRVVDDFAAEMKARLREQALKGYRGWDDTENYQRILDMLVRQMPTLEGEEVDTANLAMILWSMRRQRARD